MLRLIKRYHDLCMVAVSEYADLTKLLSIPSKERIGRAKYLLESQMDSFDDIDKQMMVEINAIMGGEAHV